MSPSPAKPVVVLLLEVHPGDGAVSTETCRRYLVSNTNIQ